MLYQKINLHNVKVLARKRQLSMTSLAIMVGMTYVGLTKLIRENTTTLSTIMRISEALNVPVQFFFMDEEELEIYNDFNLERFHMLKDEVDRLKAENMELKDKIIRLADRL